MTILNRQELVDKINLLYADNTTGDISAQNLRTIEVDQLDSGAPYGCLISGGEINNETIPNDPGTIVWPHFNANLSTENELFKPDQANNCLLVKQPCLVLISMTLNGRWSTGEDLQAEVYLNGAPHPTTPVISFQEGVGSNDPTNFALNRQFFAIDQAAITAGGGMAKITLVLSSVTGTFLLDQLSMLFGCEYIAYTIRTS